MAQKFPSVFWIGVWSVMMWSVSLIPASNLDQSILQEGHDILTEFYGRYNTTREVDLVFVLDRSGSVPREGWTSMLNFIRDILQHFTVDKDNTRVAVVTFSTRATIDINDIPPGMYTDGENKCTLNRRIKDYLEIKVPHGYTATYEGLQLARHILMDSRPHAKKAVFVLTDGKSNIGPPPVKVAFDILSLKWDLEWDEARLGPQVEIYAFGIEEAQIAELQSMSSDLPQHVFLIPNFQLFEQLARSLHGGQQAESWLLSERSLCGGTVCGKTALCMCGTRQGQYACGCNPGEERFFQRNIMVCMPCREGYYKVQQSPDPCVKCPANTTTYSPGASSRDKCELLPGLRECPTLPDITHGSKFFVAGSSRTEVADTGISCNGTTDGNSCHYACARGYRLSGSPIMLCNASGEWEGTVPTCEIINCQTLEAIDWEIKYASAHYINTTTTYGSLLQVECDSNRVALGNTVWSCGRHGRWNKPSNFKCAEVFCSALPSDPALIVRPAACASGEQPLNQNCSLSCQAGYRMEGADFMVCGFEQQAAWSNELPRCIDIEAPVIQCPPDLEVQVTDYGQNTTTIYYDTDQPVVTDNSNKLKAVQIVGAPADYTFKVGYHVLTYEVQDVAGNRAVPCQRKILVRGKAAQVLSCPVSMSLAVNNVLRQRRVTWEEPVFVGPENSSLSHTCSIPNNSSLSTGTNNVVCYADRFPVVKCEFQVNITDPECPEPFMDHPPKYGSLVCAENEYHYPKICRVMCRTGYELFGYDPDHSWKCKWDGTWTIDKPWPNCARTFRPAKALIEDEMHIRYEGDCEESREQIRTAFMYTVYKILERDHENCHETGSCAVDNVKVTCGQKSKRSVLSVFESLLARHRHKRSVTEAGENVKISFSLSTSAVDVDPNNVTKEEQKQLTKQLATMHFDIEEQLMDKGSMDINGTEAEINSLEFLGPPSFELNCTEGNVLEVGEDHAACYKCPVGTWKNGSAACEECARDTYQDEDGQLTCKPCPTGTHTLYEGATSRQLCRAPCPPGHHSSTGFEPCQPCPRGTYQSDTTAVSCMTCEGGYSTESEGATGEQECVEKCAANSWSAGGVAPCEPCALGTYQPLPGRSRCVSCSPHVHDPYCPVVVNCTESHQQCGHGRCIINNGTAGCLCDPGYHGDHCDLDINECASRPCENNGTCVDGIAAFQCQCLEGYAGKNCELALNPCDSSPCLHGYCVNHHHSYECICQDGWNGTHCDHDIDECARDPCQHGNCTDRVDGFLCTCQPYYTGSVCDVLVDLCSGMDCHRGRCHMDAAGPRCHCKAGYTGQYCETRVDYCVSEPCHNNARCHSHNDGYVCRCRRGYGGQDCDTAVSADFDLVFPRSSIDSFVLLRRPVNNLYELTVVMWVRSWDVYNYGTILSYAVEDSWMSEDKSNILTLYDCSSLQLHVNGEVALTNVSLVGGWWQHVAVTWESGGGWQLYLNGSLTAHGNGLSEKKYIQDDGYLVLGQEQDSMGGGFSQRESFVGELSQLNMYDHVLSSFVIAELAGSSSNSDPDSDLGSDLDPTSDPGSDPSSDFGSSSGQCVVMHGNVLKWTEVVGHVYGAVEIRTATRCLDINECMVPEAHNCSENEICTDAAGGFTCEPCDGEMPGCVESRPPDPCEKVSCQNGGRCETSGTSAKCVCPSYFTGALCEVAINQSPHSCVSNPCLNGGRCGNVDNTVFCECPDGYGGDWCEKVTDWCSFQQCKNGGKCILTDSNGKKDFRCECVGPWKGRYCHIFYQPKCSHNPCLNDGVCVINTNSMDGYQCMCPHPEKIKYGPNCELETPCDSRPCRNNGTCIVMADQRYLCVCVLDFNGDNCEWYKDELLTTTTADPCGGVRCENGGTCAVTHAGQGKCDCPVDYEGIRCQIKRESVHAVYQAVVSLQMTYTPSLAKNDTFKQLFTEQVEDLYKKKTPDSKVSVSINDIMKGSVLVDFSLKHDQYGGKKAGSEEMRAVLEEELDHGQLGTLKASMHKFEFTQIKEVSDPSLATPVRSWLYAVIGVLIVVIVVVLILVTLLILRRRKANLLTAMKKVPPRMDRVRFTGRTDNAVGGAVAFTFHEESIYAEPEDEDNRRNRAKAWKDDWQARQTIPLPPKPDEALLPGQRIALEEQRSLSLQRSNTNTENTPNNTQKGNTLAPEDSSDGAYLAPCKGTPPPSYRTAMDAKNKAEAAAAAAGGGMAEEEDAYFTPLSDDQEGLLGKAGANEGVVNTSFEEDTYLQPRKGGEKIDSDHESDEERETSRYLPMNDKRNTLPQIVLTEHDVPNYTAPTPKHNALKAEQNTSEDGPLTKHNAPKSNHNAPVTRHNDHDYDNNVPKDEAKHTYENQSDSKPASPTYENQSSDDKNSVQSQSNVPTETDDTVNEGRGERNKLTRQPAEHSIEEDEATEDTGES